VREGIGVAETESTAQVNDAQAGIRCEQFRHKLERGFMRRRKEYDFRATFGDSFDRERTAGRLAPAAKLWKQLREASDIRISLAKIEYRPFDMWVPQQEPGQLESRIARGSDDGDPQGVVHRSISSMRF
jgi:hypothetical protein